LRGVLRHDSDPHRGTKRMQSAAMVAAAAAFLAVGSVWWGRGRSTASGGSGAALLTNPTFTLVTDQAGQEPDPSLAPHGTSLVYAGRAAGNWDIYFQKIGEKTPVNLTSDSEADDTQPAFSPDGARIAFRSERDGGGIFVMDAAGGNVRRITNFGYDPAWS